MVAAAERAGRVVGRRRAAERGGFIGQAFVRGRLLRGWEDAGVGGKLYPDSGILRRHHESTTHNHSGILVVMLALGLNLFVVGVEMAN
jgi:hypothetical protein